MKVPKIAVLAALLAAAAAPLLAAPRLCGNGFPPKLSGDLFSPAECSTKTLTTAALPGTPVRDGGPGLKDLDGRWEGTLIHALGRYELLLEVKTGWGGKAELILSLKELQFRDRVTDRLALAPAKGRGAYEAVLTSSVVPEASLKGTAAFGSAAPAETGEADRQADLAFSNGAAHRVVFALKGKTEMRVRAFSAIPGAPLQKFELVLTKTKREKL